MSQNEIKAIDKAGNEKETPLSASPMVIGSSQLEAIEERLKGIEEMTPGLPMSGKYREFTEGEQVRGVFVGFKPIEKDGDSLNAVWWIASVDGSAQLFLNAGASLVKQIQENQVQQGEPLQITLTGTEKTNAGHKVKIYDVRRLN